MNKKNMQRENSRLAKVQRKIRLTQAEDKALEDVMKALRRTNFNTYAKECLIPGFQHTEVKLAKKIENGLIYEINKLGVNLNQIAKRLNSEKSAALLPGEQTLLTSLQETLSHVLEQLLK